VFGTALFTITTTTSNSTPPFRCGIYRRDVTASNTNHVAESIWYSHSKGRSVNQSITFSMAAVHADCAGEVNTPHYCPSPTEICVHGSSVSEDTVRVTRHLCIGPCGLVVWFLLISDGQ